MRNETDRIGNLPSGLLVILDILAQLSEVDSLQCIKKKGKKRPFGNFEMERCSEFQLFCHPGDTGVGGWSVPRAH